MAQDRLPSSITISSGGSSLPNHGVRKRVFIGPMPERVISQTEKHAKQNKAYFVFRNVSEDQDTDDISVIIKQNALGLFLRGGGRPEDWGEDEERNVIEEMIRRWRNSEWGNFWHHRSQQDKDIGIHNRASYWVGTSFEIGRFLGVDMLKSTPAASNKERPSMTSASARDESASMGDAGNGQHVVPPSSGGHETSVTSATHSNETAFIRGGSVSVGGSLPTSSSASLLRQPIQLIGEDERKHGKEAHLRTVATPPPESGLIEGAIPNERKGKTKLVHYDSYDLGVTSVANGVGKIHNPGSSLTLNPDGNGVVIRDRMFVRACYTKSEHLITPFDEAQNRTTRDLLDANWGEYLVVWRNNCIELYTDFRLLGEKWLLGHKKLAFTIPLTPSRTRLSLYSFVDLTFCITCQTMRPLLTESKSLWPFSGTTEGTNIFVLKLKSRTRAYDWTWLLWQQLGGTLPKSISVRNPRVNTKVQIDIPLDDPAQVFLTFTRENIIALSTDALSLVPDWKAVLERELFDGTRLELAWRSGTNLDWIWLDNDVEGHRRKWAVLCGLAIQQPRLPPALEIRLAEHYPAYIHLKNGSRLHEPPAIEGYVERIRPNSQVKQSLYLSTHDGNLFVLTPSHAYPPSPPGLIRNFGDIDSYAETLRKSEVQRGALQVMHAIGVNDLRSILIIRRASHLAPQSTHKEHLSEQESDIWFGIWSQSEDRTPADEQDTGGEEGLRKAEDKSSLRMRRCFELLLASGRVIRFETHSCRVAIEWIERLRALVLYWKQRHQIDAKEEMDLAQSLRPRLTPLRHVKQDGEFPLEPPVDNSAPMSALGTLYSWCILADCKPIVKGGKLFIRKGLYGQYRLVQLFIAAGHLIQFRIAPKSSLHPSMRKTNLMDAYVFSGYLAAMTLPEGQYKAASSPGPRRYQDGLETDDPEEDMLFMIWYTPSSTGSAHSNTEPASMSFKSIPSLSAKRKVLICRTRSKLERDAWCWALNCEIEKLVRKHRERENQLRETKGLIP